MIFLLLGSSILMIFLMDLPNPIHGMSNVNLAVLNKANELGLKPRVINTVPSYAARLFNTRLWSLFKIAHTLYCYTHLFLLSFFNIKGVVYRPINGGAGQVYDLLYILLCRLFLNKIYIHHHSFNYLNDKSMLFFALNKAAGPSAVHVVLGERMGELLTKLYGIENKNIKVVSNLSLFGSKSIAGSSQDSEQVVLGHLANLCIEKGVGVFIDVCRALKVMNVDFKAKVAGPFADDTARNTVLMAAEEFPEIEYLGPLYAREKEDFYQSIDCFVFPSMYKNEAEPLVLYEAALTGGYLVGSRRGCMQDVITRLSGSSIDEGSEMVELIVQAIITKVENKGLSSQARSDRVESFQVERNVAQAALTGLLADMEKYELPKSR
jgi:Glycosyltransferase